MLAGNTLKLFGENPNQTFVVVPLFADLHILAELRDFIRRTKNLVSHILFVTVGPLSSNLLVIDDCSNL